MKSWKPSIPDPRYFIRLEGTATQEMITDFLSRLSADPPLSNHENIYVYTEKREDTDQPTDFAIDIWAQAYRWDGAWSFEYDDTATKWQAIPGCKLNLVEDKYSYIPQFVLDALDTLINSGITRPG